MEETLLETISNWYGGQRTVDILNNYFGTDRFFYKDTLRGCASIYIKGYLDTTDAECYRLFIKGLMVGINIA